MKNNFVPLVSVIVPIYKKEDTLERCIQSILLSSYKNIEVILVDDGSPDNCGDICDNYSKSDERVIVIHKKNEGVSVARNVGIEVSKGTYITFVDADDVLGEKFVEGLLNFFLEDTKVDIVVGMNRNPAVSSCKAYGKVFDQDDAIRMMFDDDRFGVNVWGKIFQRETIGETRFPKGIRMGEDMCFLFDCLMNAEKVFFVPECNYTQIGSVYNSSNLSSVEHYMEALEITGRCKKKALDAGLAKCRMAISKAIIVRALWTVNRMIAHGEIDDKYIEICRTEIKENNYAINELSMKHRIMGNLFKANAMLYITLFGNAIRRRYSNGISSKKIL